MNPSQVFLRPTDAGNPGAPWEALLQMTDGTVQALSPAGLEVLAGQLPAGRLIMLVPGSRVLLTRVEMPTRNSRAMMKALPYALEDQLADDVESLHFVPGARDPDGRLRVAVVSVEDMQAWREALRGQGLEPRLMVPETAVLPTAPDAWTIWLEGSLAWLATAEGDGMAMERDNAAFLLQLHWDETPPERRPERLEIRRHGSALPEDQALERLEPALGIPVARPVAAAGLAAAIVEAWPKSAPFNLASGAFSPRDGLGRWWRPWRPAAALLLALVVVQFIALGWELHTLQAERDRLEREITQVFERTFPGSRVVDPRRQMQSALNSLHQGQGGGPTASGLEALLTVAGPALAAEQGLMIQSLRYQPGRLDLDLHLADLQSLDRLRRQLESNPGWSVEIQSASTREDRVDSRILIRSNES
ncbi:type II secretion system protein GspL [Ectothiorhodospira shaposhnikovii]|uniref:type II secretion system protein GspL n=1 Tax=Ectothiorhodospira shaposhnikovii TaxID=1054 RepID=UPI0039A05CF8